ncbi:MAG TPA: hypothetical protein VI522_05100, partial [Gammaproteobacteria bacterium]|nr:hypothetical protein [Gammaproteobacteria bacterium]
MKKIALLSSRIALGLFAPEHRLARSFSHEKMASTQDLSHFIWDYQLLIEALTQHQCAPELVSWDDPDIDWRTFDGVLIHSVWDYYEHQQQFLTVLREIDAHTRLFNSLATVTWNSDKKYLQDLSEAGIPIIASTFIPIVDTPDI